MNDPSRKYVKNPRFDFIVNDLWMTILIWKNYWKSFNSIAIQWINKNFIKLTKLHNIGPNQRTDLIICVTRRRWHSPVVTWETGKKNLRWTRRNEIVRNMMRHQHLISGRFLSIEKKKTIRHGTFIPLTQLIYEQPQMLYGRNFSFSANLVHQPTISARSLQQMNDNKSK